MPSPSSYAGLRNPVGTHVQVGKGLVKGALAHAAEVGCRDHPGVRRQPPRLGALGRRPVGRRAFRAACETSRDAGVHPHALPGEPGLADPVDVREVGGLGGAQPQAGRGDRRRGRRGAHRLLRRRGHPGRRDAPGARGPAAGARRGRRGRALAAARADRRPGPLAVRRGRRPRALPRRARPAPAASASAWTPATCSPPAPRSTSPAAPPRPSTGWSRSPARTGSGWCTPTTRWTCAARSRTGTRASARATSALGAFEELFAHPATEGVPFVLETPGSRDAGDPQIALLQKLRER